MKKLIQEGSERDPNKRYTVTLINEAPVAYYSGMLPGAVARLYRNEEIIIHMAPLAEWSCAEYIEQRVMKIDGDSNKVYLNNGESVDYDVLAVNVGSRTLAADNVKGVWEHSLTTRPINELLPKITAKEQDLKSKGIVPTVAVCGGGASGTELSFAFKRRWSEYFGKEIDLTLIC